MVAEAGLSLFSPDRNTRFDAKDWDGLSCKGHCGENGKEDIGCGGVGVDFGDEGHKEDDCCGNHEAEHEEPAAGADA